MGTIPTIPTFTNPITSAHFAAIKAASDFWALTPRCYAYASATQSIPTGLTPFTLIQFNAEVYDIVQSGDSPMHDNTTLNSRIVIRTPGKYEITSSVEFASNATGIRSAAVRLNAAGVDGAGTALTVQTQAPVTGAGTNVSCPTVEVALVAGDHLEVFVRQNSGGALNTSLGQAQTFLRVKLTGA